MRTFDASHLNQIANRPDVRPRLGGAGNLDLAPILANPRNYAFENHLGGFVCINIFGMTYEVHTIFTPERKGVEDIVNLMFQAELFMFSKTDCVELVSKVPDGNVGAGRLADRFCFTDVGKQKNWSNGISAALKRKTLEDWARQSPETYVAGRTFHETIEKAKSAQGSNIEGHEDDVLHDMIVGASFLMVKGGQVHKGLGFYNYWASFAGYNPAAILSEHPLVVDIGAGIRLGFDNGTMEVHVCR